MGNKIRNLFITAAIILSYTFMFTLGTKYNGLEYKKEHPRESEQLPLTIERQYEEIQVDDSVLGQLYKINLEKQRNIITTGYWNHSNADGTTFKERVENLSGTTSENLYRGYTCDIRFAIQMWNESPTHLENMDREYDAGIITIQRVDENTCYINFVHNKSD